MTTDRGAGGNEMNDIVDRLRGQEPLRLGDRSAAAYVIDRLRAELAECRTVKESLLVALERYGTHAPAGMPCGLCEAVSAALAADGASCPG